MNYVSIKSTEGKLILAATILASGMAFLDGSVVTIAIPVIQSTLHATLDSMQWVVNIYTLMLAALILISGSLGDKLGRKRVFLYGIGLFALSSLLCGLSQTIGQLIAARTLQGIGGALMIPGSLSIINTSFEEKVRGSAIGLWSGFAGGVAALGPFLGGWLVQTLGWSSIFFINVPLGILALFLTLRFVPETKNPDTHRLDFLGTALIFISLLTISYSLIEGPILGWNNSIVIGGLALGIVTFFAFAVTEMKVKEPLVPLHIFSSKLVTGANIATLFLYFALNGVIFFFVLNLEQLQQYPPLFAGLSLLPTILLITFLSGPAGGLSDKIGPRLPMIVGPLIVSVGMVLLTLAGNHVNYFISFFPGLVLFGIGMATVIAPLTKSALAVEHKFSGAASGVNNAVARVAALLAVALLGAIVLFLFSSQLTKNIVASSLSTFEKQQILSQKNKLGAIELPSSFSDMKKAIAKENIDDALLYSFRSAMGIGAFLAFLSAITSFLTITNPPKKS